ncbi:MAG TPA: anthranilate phosphoribosyltransferase [Myxococcota bacterium]|nr:anthranilate phosphoribosyltransferase [Myxococcota bacterium]
MSLRDAIERAMRREEVPAETLEAAFVEIAAGKASEIEITALLVALRTKGETQREIVAAARALRASGHSAPCLDPRTLDTCGTGGDGAGTFNVSTTAAFVVAGAGVPVAKHGNRAASSRAGSIDVLEALGVSVDLPVDASARILAEVGIAPFFAARAHPAMRHVAAVRRTLGVRTVMNCMGPLLNPLGVRHQLVGVYARALVEPLAGALAELGARRALVVHGRDGLDEITTAEVTDAAFLEGGRVRTLAIDPGALGIATPPAGALAGGDAHRNAEILRAVLDGEHGPRRDIALLNAGAALWVADAAADLGHGMQVAARSVDSGAARRKLDALVEASHRAVRAA